MRTPPPGGGVQLAGCETVLAGWTPAPCGLAPPFRNPRAVQHEVRRADRLVVEVLLRGGGDGGGVQTPCSTAIGEKTGSTVSILNGSIPLPGDGVEFTSAQAEVSFTIQSILHPRLASNWHRVSDGTGTRHSHGWYRTPAGWPACAARRRTVWSAAEVAASDGGGLPMWQKNGQQVG